MNNFEELMDIWQSQNSPVEDADFERQLPELSRKLDAFRKKQLRVNILKTIVLFLIIIQFTWMMLKYSEGSIVLLSGLVWIVICTAAFMAIYWKKQFRLSDLNVNKQSVEFIEYTLKRLREQKRLFKVYFPIFAFSLILGLNVIYMDIFPAQSIMKRLITHAGMSLIILASYAIGLWFRSRRFKKELDPLIDELNTILEDLKC